MSETAVLNTSAQSTETPVNNTGNQEIPETSVTLEFLGNLLDVDTNIGQRLREIRKDREDNLSLILSIALRLKEKNPAMKGMINRLIAGFASTGKGSGKRGRPKGSKNSK